MTIIEPNKSKYQVDFLPFALALVFVCFAIFSIYIYNQNVGLGHLISRGLKELQAQRVQNGDLKNQFYQALNSQAVESLARQKGLVQEKNPNYLENKPLTLH